VAVSDQEAASLSAGSPIASLAPGASDGTTYTGSYENHASGHRRQLQGQHGRGDER